MNNNLTEILFQDRLPKEILRELTPEVRRQYFLWDEIMKREIELYPWLILPVIKEVFHKEYPADRNIVLLSTEYTVSWIYEKGERLFHAIRSGLMMKLDDGRYRFVCQIEQDGKMVFHMLEYDVHITSPNGRGKESEGMQVGYEVSFPKSAILYLENEEDAPEQEACTFRFRGEASHLCKVPVIKVQEYSLESIEEKHLNLLIPFLLFRFKDRISKVVAAAREGISLGKAQAGEDTESRSAREALKQEMVRFIRQCMTVLEYEEESGAISGNARKDIGELLWKVCRYLLEKDVVLYREVRDSVEPVIRLSREIIQELQERKQNLQERNQKLQERRRELHQQRENACRRLIEKAKREGKSEEDVVKELIEIFELSEETAKEKIKAY